MIFSNDQIGTIGYVSSIDRRGFELDPRTITDGRNMRCEDGAMQPVRGFQNVLAPSFTSLWADWALNTGGSWWVLFSGTQAFSYEGTTYTDITGPGFSVNPAENLHSTTKLSGILCVTDGKGPPQAQYDLVTPSATGPTTPFVELPGWNTNETCQHLIAHKNYLIAMNLATAEDFLPNAIRWSNAAVPGKLPDTWVPAPDNDASDITILGADSGAIVGAQLMRDDVIIYTETATFRLYFVGGDRVYDVRRIFRNRGMYGPRCVAEFRGRHYVVTDDDVIVHDGVNAQSIADGRVRKFLQRNLTQENKNFVAMFGHRAESEVGIMYSPNAAPEPATESLAFNVLNKTWNPPQDEPSMYWKRDMPDLNFSIVEGLKWDDEVLPDDTWDTGPDLPALVAVGDLIDAFQLFGGDDGTTIYQFNIGNLMDWSGNTNPGGFPVCFMDHEDLNFSGDTRTCFMHKLFPRMESDGNVEIYTSGKFSMDEVYLFEGPYTFNPDTDHEVSMRTSGRRHAVRYRVADGTQFRVFGYDVEFVDTGRY